jgi:two-component system invasion response regulator UvrY
VSRRPKVVIAEDHEMFSQGLRTMLGKHCQIVASVRDGLEVVPTVLEQAPDILLLDLSLPHRTGLDILGDLHEVAPGQRVIVVTMHVDRVMVDASLRLGAAGFVPKDATVEELQAAIGEVMEGRVYISPRLPKQTWGEGGDQLGFGELTARQQEIVRMIGQGMTTEQIAANLGLSTFTVQFHRKNIRRRLGLESDFAMLRYAILIGLSQVEAEPETD